jgi:hypothetical protein
VAEALAGEAALEMIEGEALIAIEEPVEEVCETSEAPLMSEAAAASASAAPSASAEEVPQPPESQS